MSARQLATSLLSAAASAGVVASVCSGPSSFLPANAVPARVWATGAIAPVLPRLVEEIIQLAGFIFTSQRMRCRMSIAGAALRHPLASPAFRHHPFGEVLKPVFALLRTSARLPDESPFWPSSSTFWL